MNNIFVWIGIAFCVSQSAMFSGLNLAFFSLTRLRLEIEAEQSLKPGARTVLSMRKDSNFLLTTILWGNVSINVLLTLLSESVMIGAISFIFSTVVITLFGEILPQAYFSRHALAMASRFAPLLRMYQFILYPVAKPCALMLDSWLGKEAVQFFSEENIKMFIKKHMEGHGVEIGHIEGTGAINFLILDDQKITDEGEHINPESIINLPTEDGIPVFPEYLPERGDTFIQRFKKIEEKWAIFTNEKQEPVLVLDIDGFIRSDIFCSLDQGILSFCHKPLVIMDSTINLGSVVKTLKSTAEAGSDSPIKMDVVLFWCKEGDKRIITGADLFGRLLKGI